MSNPPIQTVGKLFEVIALLDQLDGASMTEVSTRLGMSTSTASDYLISLKRTGYVIQGDDGYELSTKFLEVGGRVKHRKRLFQAAKSELATLAEISGELACLTIEERGYSVILHMEAGDQAHHFGGFPGMRTPLHSHAGGKVILAYLERHTVEDIIKERGLIQRTRKTITDKEELFDQLEQIQQDGYAIDYDEQVDGMAIVAAPILVEDGSDIAGAISAVLPTRRVLNEGKTDRLIDAVLEAANVAAINYRYGRRRD